MEALAAIISVASILCIVKFTAPVEVPRESLEKILSVVDKIDDDLKTLKDELAIYLVEQDFTTPSQYVTTEYQSVTPEIENGTSPRLVFEPNPAGRTTLIRFNKARPSTFEPFVNSLKRTLEGYQNERWAQVSDAVVDCSSFHGYRPADAWLNACKFGLPELGADCVLQQSFGYEDGQPCVLFHLDRVYRWLPVPYDNSSVPNAIRDVWSQYSVSLKCEAADAPSRDHIGDLTYHPPNGFEFKYFPDLGQSEWKPPLMFVRFENPDPAKLIRVVCKVYARNIVHNSILDTGMVSFELLVD